MKKCSLEIFMKKKVRQKFEYQSRHNNQNIQIICNLYSKNYIITCKKNF